MRPVRVMSIKPLLLVRCAISLVPRGGSGLGTRLVCYIHCTEEVVPFPADLSPKAETAVCTDEPPPYLISDPTPTPNHMHFLSAMPFLENGLQK